MVGEYGPEMAVLPYGTNVVPNGAAQARQSSIAQPAMTFYAPVYVTAATPDIQREITRALSAQGRV